MNYFIRLNFIHKSPPKAQTPKGIVELMLLYFDNTFLILLFFYSSRYLWMHAQKHTKRSREKFLLISLVKVNIQWLKYWLLVWRTWLTWSQKTISNSSPRGTNALSCFSGHWNCMVYKHSRRQLIHMNFSKIKHILKHLMN